MATSSDVEMFQSKDVNKIKKLVKKDVKKYIYRKSVKDKMNRLTRGSMVNADNMHIFISSYAILKNVPLWCGC